MRTNKFIPLLISVCFHLLGFALFWGRPVSSTIKDLAFAAPSKRSGNLEIDLTTFSLKKSAKNNSHAKNLEKDFTSEKNGGAVSNNETVLAIPHQNGPVFNNFIKPVYPPIARSQGLEGTVKVSVNYNAEGLVTKVELTQSSGFSLLDQSVKNAAQKWRLSPNISGGNFQQSFSFKLNQ